MNIVDAMEAWWLSVQPLLEAEGVVGSFMRSATDILNPSCAVNLRRNEREADLIVWESGEAELAMVEPGGSINEQHFDDMRTVAELSTILSRLMHVASDGASKEEG